MKNQPIATINGIDIHRRTFEAKKHPKGSTARDTLNLNSLTSEYMTSYKYYIHKFPNISDSARTKDEAIAKATRYSNTK